MIWHSSDTDTVLNFLGTDKENGLSSQKAEELLTEKFLEAEKPMIKFLKMILAQLRQTAVLSVIIVSLICTFLSIVSKEAWWPYITVIIMLLIGAVSFCLQEYFTKDARHQVKNIRRCFVDVLRDGEVVHISSDRIVQGDIILLNTGDYIPVDARLIETINFSCDEYALTGEIVDVKKDCTFIAEDITAIEGRINMVFAGCSVTHGSAKAVVTDIDNDTEIKRIKLLNKKSDSNNIPFNKTIETVKKYSFTVAAVTAALIWFILMILNLTKNEQSFALFIGDTLINTIPILIAAVPETLPITAALIIWASIKVLSEKGIIFNKLSALEKTANISLICADKTGVLTPDDMSIAEIFDGNDFKTDLANPGNAAILTAKLALVCGNGVDNTAASNQIDDSSQRALYDFCSKFEISEREQLNNMYPLLAKIPFDSARQRLTTVNMISGKPVVITKGAPEKIIPLCRNINVDKLNSVYEEMATRELRVVAVAYRPISELPAFPTAEELEQNLIFAGFIGLSDTPDSDIIATVEQCEYAGIKTVMTTGDSEITSKAIARRIGIFHDGLESISGDKLKSFSDEHLDTDVTGYAVFARLDDNDRYRIVKALMHNNETVAVTGSKSTDAPILRKADVGFAISDTATDVAKNAADIIVANGRISTLLNVIKNARNVFEQIKRIIHYFISCNLGELLVLFIGALLFSNPILIASQLLLINLITDILPCVALGLSPADNSLLSKNAKKKRQVFTTQSTISLIIQSVIICTLTLIASGIGNIINSQVAQTMALVTLSILQIIHIFPSYSEQLLIDSNILKHKYIFIGSALCLVLLLIIVLSPLRTAFGLVALTGQQWLLISIFAIIMFAADELIKIGFKLYYKYKK